MKIFNNKKDELNNKISKCIIKEETIDIEIEKYKKKY